MSFLPFLISGLAVGAIYALSGVGLVVLFRATGTVNLAFGALGALGALVAWSIIAAGWPAPTAWIAAVVVAALGSVGYGRLIAPRLSHRDRVVRAVGTLGFALLLLGFMGWYWGETPRRITLPTDSLYVTIFSVRLNLTRLLTLALSVGMVAGVVVFLTRTRIGLAMRALANDRELSSLIGVRVLRAETVAWLISGVFAGIGGLLLSDMVRLQPTFLVFLVIPAIAAAILGGLASLPATAVGGLSMGVVEAVLTGVPVLAPYRTAAPYVIALLFVAALGRNTMGSLQE